MAVRIGERINRMVDSSSVFHRIEVMRSSQTGGAELNFGSRLISGISQDIKFKRSVKSFGLGGGWKEGDGLEPPSTTPCPPDTISGCKTPL